MLDYAKIFSKKRKELKRIIQKNHGNRGWKTVEKAYAYSKNSHKGQKRASGSPYFIHPVNTALILARLGASPTMVVAGLLHDVLEDCDITGAEFKDEFGKELYSLVEGVTKIHLISEKSRRQNQVANLQKILFATTKDIRVLVVKLADKLHNIRTLKYLKPRERKRHAKEAITVYAPLAYRLGLQKVQKEMEDLSFEVLEPELFSSLRKKLVKKRRQKKSEIKALVKILKPSFPKTFGFDEYEKSVYRTHLKLQSLSGSIDELYQSITLKVLTPKVEDCYLALGVIHGRFNPLPGKLKDFIALPRSNLYRAIHTSVYGPKGNPIQIFILTKEMNEIRKRGVLAVSDLEKKVFERLFNEKVSSVSKQSKSLKLIDADTTYIKALKSDFLTNTMYVFTPKGDTVELPVRSIPIDFAFAIDKDLGLKCWKARINGVLRPVTKTLNKGDIVEIVSSKKPVVMKNWLNSVRSHQAKTEISRWLETSRRSRKSKTRPSFIDLEVICQDTPGQLAKIAGVISRAKININAATAGTINPDETHCHFNINGENLLKLKTAIPNIRAIDGVKKASFTLNK